MSHNFRITGKDNAKEDKTLQSTSTPSLNNLVRQTWLHYFNDYLRERGVITEEEWRKMRRMIGGS